MKLVSAFGVGLVVLSFCAAGCGDSDKDSDSAATTEAMPPAPVPVVTWGPCEEEDLATLECATVAVPMNYRNPAGEQINLAISRLAASDPSRRRGVLFTNPGGPGGTGRKFPTYYAEQPITQVYDIIGIDVRGLGKSTQLAACAEVNTDDLEIGSRTRPSDADMVAMAEQAKREEAACAAAGGEFRKYVTTMNVARDMDSLRAGLGEDKINYLGTSYGTWVGAVYGEMFADRLDRNVLDSSLDPRVSWREGDVNNAAAIEQNFTRWTEWAAARDSVFHLGATSEAVRGSIDEIAAAIMRGPVAGIDKIDDFDKAVGTFTRYRKSWASFAKSMRDVLAEVHGAPPNPALAASNKHALGVSDDLEEESEDRDEADEDSDSVQAAVLCEWDWPTDPEVYFRDMRKERDSFPYGNTVGQVAIGQCAFDKVKDEPLVKVGPARYPRGLVLNSEGDTQTSLVDGTAAAKELGSVLIVVKNEGGHGMYSATPPNVCLDERVNAYLIDGVLPDDTVNCDTADPPMAVAERPDESNPDPAATIPLLGESADAVEQSVDEE